MINIRKNLKQDQLAKALETSFSAHEFIEYALCHADALGDFFPSKDVDVLLKMLMKAKYITSTMSELARHGFVDVENNETLKAINARNKLAHALALTELANACVYDAASDLYVEENHLLWKIADRLKDAAGQIVGAAPL